MNPCEVALTFGTVWTGCSGISPDQIDYTADRLGGAEQKRINQYAKGLISMSIGCNMF